MYDLSSRFNTFYRSYVVLPQSEQNSLYHKKDLNLQRLKDGLKEYNDEYKTSYAIVEDCVQGSVAMSTVVQNENSDYDIDAAVVFSKSALGDKGALAARNMVANALRRKTKQFNIRLESPQDQRAERSRGCYSGVLLERVARAQRSEVAESLTSV